MQGDMIRRKRTRVTEQAGEQGASSSIRQIESTKFEKWIRNYYGALTIILGSLFIVYILGRNLPTNFRFLQVNLKQSEDKSRIQIAGLNSDLEDFSLLPSSQIVEDRLMVFCSHHRTGTQFIAQMSQETSKAFGYNYQMVDVAFDLNQGSKSSVLFYFPQTNVRIIGAMHGFLETCEGHDVTLVEDRVFQVHDCLLDDIDCNLDACRMKLPQPIVDLRYVHFVRNPVEVLISSYLYHRQDIPAEEWLYEPKPEIIPEEIKDIYNTTPYFQFLQQADSIDGLKAEFLRIVNELYQMVRNWRDTEALKGGYNVRFEDLGGDYREFNEDIFFRLGLIRPDIMWKHFLRLWKNFDVGRKDAKMWKQADVQAHVTEGRYDKSALRKVLKEDNLTEALLSQLANAMGYLEPFGEIVQNHTRQLLQDDLQLRLQELN